ncbi:uncharacterized protein BDZ99DRAFT_176464 [Mytilinidion resinicola]|uniref:GRF-type domain-containing protein n=1 Tax=Mytilinidion resinicola TaxID=574789 RepID=A0A6A6Y2V7_9PEZI|nr:uncharacterized protein BDZ99DRAFT_176464 [Mytilinidion resinicola]KAF2802863.1 hypothetical protein BDZ99DRAFT_176464 [Mytilinidion resinicola]
MCASLIRKELARPALTKRVQLPYLVLGCSQTFNPTSPNNPHHPPLRPLQTHQTPTTPLPPPLLRRHPPPLHPPSISRLQRPSQPKYGQIPTKTPTFRLYSRLGRLYKANWYCDCGLQATWERVNKCGPSKGKRFLRCPKHIGKQCPFILWEEHEAIAKKWFKCSRPL